MSEQVTTGFLFLVNGEEQVIPRWIHLAYSELCICTLEFIFLH